MVRFKSLVPKVTTCSTYVIKKFINIAFIFISIINRFTQYVFSWVRHPKNCKNKRKLKKYSLQILFFRKLYITVQTKRNILKPKHNLYNLFTKGNMYSLERSWKSRQFVYFHNYKSLPLFQYILTHNLKNALLYQWTLYFIQKHRAEIIDEHNTWR